MRFKILMNTRTYRFLTALYQVHSTTHRNGHVQQADCSGFLAIPQRHTRSAKMPDSIFSYVILQTVQAICIYFRYVVFSPSAN